MTNSLLQVIEFVKGHVAFPGAASKKGTWSSEDDHLAQYMEVLGPMPSELLRDGTKTSEYFDNEGTHCLTCLESGEIATKLTTFLIRRKSFENPEITMDQSGDIHRWEARSVTTSTRYGYGGSSDVRGLFTRRTDPESAISKDGGRTPAAQVAPRDYLDTIPISLSWCSRP